MTKPMYSNCRMLSVDGELLSHISRKRMDWYLKRNLAVALGESEIQLTFKHKGSTENQPKIYTEQRANICVVCASTSNLTWHHIVPYAYKKHFPEINKNYSSFDVAVLCLTCHETYEKHATAFKKELFVKYDVDTKKKTKARAIANTLLKHGDKITDETRTRLISNLPADVPLDPAGLQDFVEKFNESILDPNKELVSKIESIDDFIISWRTHFVEYANPKHMSESWHEEIDMKYQESNDAN